MPVEIQQRSQHTLENDLMLGRREAQTSIFDSDQRYLGHVGEKTFFGYLARHRHELFRDDDFADLYRTDWGRPSVAPSLLCTALVLQHYDGCSDQEAAESAAYDQRWKVALGTGETERPFVKSTLQLFRAQLIVHEKARSIFEASLAAARREGRLKSEGRMRAALDTTNILGRGAVRDTYNLIADGIVNLSRLLAKAAGKPLPEWMEEHDLEPYLGSSLKGVAEIDWSDRIQKEELLGALVADAKRVLELGGHTRAEYEAGSPEEERLLRASEILRQVLLQDVEPSHSGDRMRKQVRVGASGERIVSVHDPEMRHGRKSASTRFDGHKAAVVADVESQLITAVDVMAGSAKDQEGSLELIQQAEATTGLKVDTALADCAYGSADNRIAFAAAGVELLAKVPRRTNGEFFNKEDFLIDLEKMDCRCPAGQHTTKVVKAGSKTAAFRFSATVCKACPLRPECFKGKDKGQGRRVFLHPHEALLQAAREWQHGPEFDDFRKQRQVVEHRLARLVQLGIRQARYFGRRKTLFQVLMAAAIANLTLIAGPNGSRSRIPDSQEVGRPLSTLLTGLLDLWYRLRAVFGARGRAESEADASPSAPQFASARPF
ncbi:MAG: IS1182 family transposase [Streptosporangiaceae bacterium]